MHHTNIRIQLSISPNRNNNHDTCGDTVTPSVYLNCFNPLFISHYA